MTTKWIPNKVSVKDPSQIELKYHSPFRGQVDIAPCLVRDSSLVGIWKCVDNSLVNKLEFP